MSQEYTVGETHGFALLPDFTVKMTSAGLGWSKAFMSMQTEMPFSRHFNAVDDILISVIRTGSTRAEVTVDAHLHAMEAAPGGVSIIPNGLDFRADTHARLETTHFYLRRSAFDDVASDMLKGDPGHVGLIPRFCLFDPVLEHLVKAVQDAMEGQGAHSHLYVEYLANAVAARLIQTHSTATGISVSQPRERLSSGVVERVRALIDERLKTRLSADQLAEGTGMSVDHFAKLFKLTTGTTLHQFVIRCRVDRAKGLLSESSLPLVQIAFECGFSDQVHFTRVFSKMMGLTPGAYRRERKR